MEIRTPLRREAREEAATVGAAGEVSEARETDARRKKEQTRMVFRYESDICDVTTWWLSHVVNLIRCLIYTG